ncbi:MAG: SRPBCC domain-containing protein [Rhizobiales bacterium]|nr:SRPBCC domain-containing protein [Hyphomicrobiales bacterium]
MTETLATAKVSHRFSAAPERVYDAWLDPSKLRIWMKAALMEMGLSGDIRRIEVDARVGGTFFFSDIRDAGEAKHWGTYRVLDRPRKIEFTWIVDESQNDEPSVVTITIEPDGTGSIVTIAHEKIWASYVERTEMGWSRMLRAIDAMLQAR